VGTVKKKGSTTGEKKARGERNTIARTRKGRAKEHAGGVSQAHQENEKIERSVKSGLPLEKKKVTGRQRGDQNRGGVQKRSIKREKNRCLKYMYRGPEKGKGPRGKNREGGGPHNRIP